MNSDDIYKRWKNVNRILGALCISVGFYIYNCGHSAVQAQSALYKISERANESDVAIIKTYMQDIRPDIRIDALKYKADHFFVYRVVGDDFCIGANCLSIIVANCKSNRCDSVKIIASEDFVISDMDFEYLGGRLVLRFSSGTTLLINSKSIIAADPKNK